MTIGVLHAYRRRGIGRKLLTQLLESAAARKASKLYICTCRRATTRRQRFLCAVRLPRDWYHRGYYKRIQPDSCYVLAKALSDGDDPAVLLAQEVPGLEAS